MTQQHNQLLLALKDTHLILSTLLSSAALDPSTEARDCLEVFDQYEWAMKPGCDETRYQALLEKGNSGTMTEDELDEFMEMVSWEGEVHAYYAIRLGQVAIETYGQLLETAEATPEVEEYMTVAMSTAHLTKEDLDALEAAEREDDQMVLKRESGYFIKLYDVCDEEGVERNYRHGHSDTIKDIIRWALESGYRMIEFDGDATVMAQFPTFEW